MTEYNTDTVNARIEKVWKRTGLAFIHSDIENRLGVSYGVAQGIEVNPIALSSLARMAGKFSTMLDSRFIPNV